jgi:hypothetical protein
VLNKTVAITLAKLNTILDVLNQKQAFVLSKDAIAVFPKGGRQALHGRYHKLTKSVLEAWSRYRVYKESKPKYAQTLVAFVNKKEKTVSEIAIKLQSDPRDIVAKLKEALTQFESMPDVKVIQKRDYNKDYGQARLCAWYVCKDLPCTVMTPQRVFKKIDDIHTTFVSKKIMPVSDPKEGDIILYLKSDPKEGVRLSHIGRVDKSSDDGKTRVRSKFGIGDILSHPLDAILPSYLVESCVFYRPI